VRLTDGQLAWKVQTGAAIWNSPAFDNGCVWMFCPAKFPALDGCR
jgi:hypothetical protein